MMAVVLAASAVAASAQTVPQETSTASCEAAYDPYHLSRIQDYYGGPTEPATALGQSFVATKTGALTKAEVLVADAYATISGIPDRSSLLAEVRPLTSAGWPSNEVVLASDVIEANEISDGTSEWATAHFAPGTNLTKGQSYALTLSPRNGTTIATWAGAAGNVCGGGEVFTGYGGGFRPGAVNQAGLATGDRFFRLSVQPPPNAAPVAVRDDYAAGANQTLTVDAPGVLANDTDAEGDRLAAELYHGASHGELTFRADGSFVYVPSEDFMGTDSFKYQASDGLDGSVPGVVEISVNPNSPPTPTDDAAVGREETKKVVDVLSNDTDPDGKGNLNPASVRVVSQPTNGVATANTDGTVSYEPSRNFSGTTDSFRYEVCDTGKPALCASATASVTVQDTNDAPTPQDDEDATPENTAKEIKVLANDTDPDGRNSPNGLNQFTLRAVSAPAHGQILVVVERGAIKYFPDSGFNGKDSFAYEICDAGTPSLCGRATVTVTVGTPNARAVAVADAYETDEGTELTVDAPGVLANDTDAEGDALTAQLADDVQRGSLILNDNGSFTYAPDANYNGTDSFTYYANDGQADSASPATVTITVSPVNDKPACNDGRDNDHDGKVDMRDPGCKSRQDTSERNSAPKPTPRCTIKGTGGHDVIVGTSHRDVICGFGGDDTIKGRGGNDLIMGGGGNDTIQGNAGDDTIYGGDGRDSIQGNDGNDTLYGGSSGDAMQGNDGRDKLYGGGGDDALQGGAGEDTLDGGAGTNVTQQ